MEKQAFRAGILAARGASGSEIQELLAYNQNEFDHDRAIRFPLPPEAHIATWTQYAAECAARSAVEVLRDHLPQFRFPIRAGISQTDEYRAVTRRGHLIHAHPAASELELAEPDKIELMLHPSLAGAVPVLVAANRSDFVALVRALAHRNEPVPIPDSMGACTVTGYNNWERIRRYRAEWQAAQPGGELEARWRDEFRRLTARKELYQDCFIILSQGPYSDVPAAAMAMSGAASADDWRRISFTLRLAHECTHYFTRRVFGSMRNNLLDELIADYGGIVAAAGQFRAEWFLRFMGLEAEPAVQARGRLENYRGEPPVSDGAWRVLRSLVRDAALNLERFEHARRGAAASPAADSPALMLVTLAQLTLEELASEQAEPILFQTWNQARSSYGDTAQTSVS